MDTSSGEAKQHHLGPALRAAFPHTVPVLTGFLFLGIAYGVLMNAKGYGPLWSTLMAKQYADAMESLRRLGGMHKD